MKTLRRFFQWLNPSSRELSALKAQYATLHAEHEALKAEHQKLIAGQSKLLTWVKTTHLRSVLQGGRRMP